MRPGFPYQHCHLLSVQPWVSILSSPRPNEWNRKLIRGSTSFLTGLWNVWEENFCQMLHKGLSSIGILAVLPDALICATCNLVKPFPLICVVYAMVRGIYKGEEGGKGGKKRERGWRWQERCRREVGKQDKKERGKGEGGKRRAGRKGDRRKGTVKPVYRPQRKILTRSHQYQETHSISSVCELWTGNATILLLSPAVCR